MAQQSPTYTPQQAINLVQAFVHGIPLAGVQAQMCDMVNNIIWHYYPWQWTVKSFTPITLVDGQQDYTPTDTDILRPLSLRLVRTDTTPNEARELALLANLGVELTRKGGLETMQNAGWLAGSNTIRLALAASVGTGQTLQLQGFYQSLPTKIDDSKMNTAFTFPDRWFYVYVEGLKWKIYQLSDDPRSGGIEMSRNGRNANQFSGQYGIFMKALEEMARTEDLSSGDEFQFPESPLGVGRSYYPGLYGL